MPGLRAYALVRFRGALGSELVWPRYDDHFDALLAFVELERERWRLRAGRQQRLSGLGHYTFDGASGSWRPLEPLRLEAFAGRGLARGFLEPLTSGAIRSIDPLRPDEATMFLGAQASATRGPWNATAAWQREILADRSVLVSERASFDARGTVGRRLLLQGSIDGDLAAGAVGKARISAGFSSRLGYVEAELFRYRPVFDLTTIWGVFSPEAHHGFAMLAQTGWLRTVTLQARLRHRWYAPVTETTPFLIGVSDQSTEFSLGGRWQRGTLGFGATWRLLTGYGGAQSGADLDASWMSDDERWQAGLLVTAFQEEEQFRVADGTVFGAGLRLRGAFTPRLAARGDLMRYWHRPDEGDAMVNWSQLRASLGVEWTFGASADRVRAR